MIRERLDIKRVHNLEVDNRFFNVITEKLSGISD